MAAPSTIQPPRRITDLVNARRNGADVQLFIDFKIVPVDFYHRAHPFRAYVFLAEYGGAIDGTSFFFRKCYARGCPNNICMHVSQALTIANRYLQRDYHALTAVGIPVSGRLFQLEDMMVKFESLKGEAQPEVTIPELIAMAAAGARLTVSVSLDFLPAVEHFAGEKKAQTFLSGEFMAAGQDKTYHSQRCLACYGTDQEATGKTVAVKVANSRLASIYAEFDRHRITCPPTYFSP
jgi:hypothetical protein